VILESSRLSDNIWGRRALMQRVSKEERGKKKMSREDSSICSYTTKGTARKVEEKSSIHLTMENTGTLQERHP